MCEKFIPCVAADPSEGGASLPTPAGIFSAGFSCLRIDFAKILQFHYKFVAVFLHGYGRIQSETGKNLLKQRTKMRSGSCKEVQAASAPTRKRGKTCKRRSYPTRGSLFASAGFFCKKHAAFLEKSIVFRARA